MDVSESFLKIIHRCNSFFLPGSSVDKAVPFMVGNVQVGLVQPKWLEYFKEYPNVFMVQERPDKSKSTSREVLVLSEELSTFEERSQKIAGVLEDLRRKDVIKPLRGWRNECYDVKVMFSDPPLFKMERSAATLFGVVQYGAHVNGYTFNENNEMMMWISQRSPTKQTYPNMYDNLCAGGLPAGMGVEECMRKECQEEASIEDKYLTTLKPVGSVSYCLEDERGISPECEFVFDLELPKDFQPKICDGEVQKFFLLPIDKVKTLIADDNFKPNCALIIIDFMIRHGILTPDNEPKYNYLVEQMHRSLQTMYSS